MEHKCEFTIKRRNDMNTEWLYLCECGAQDGAKFWAMLNDKWNFAFNKGVWKQNQLKKFPWLRNKLKV